MRRTIAVVVVLLLVLGSVPQTLAAASGTGAITGVAKTTAGLTLSGHTVRLRSVRTGDVVATTTTSSGGSFSFARLDAGSYVVEIVDASGRIVGSSSITTVAESATASVSVIVASAARVGGAMSTALLILLIAGATAGTVGIIAAVNDSSGSQ